MGSASRPPAGRRLTGTLGLKYGLVADMQFHPVNPRLQGVREHFDRANLFVAQAGGADDSKTKYRLLLAAVYSCRAITELMLEAAEKQQVKLVQSSNPKASRDALEKLIAPKLKYYDLIERVRIHDFHRFGLTPPDPGVKTINLGGPIKITAQSGSGAVWAADTGIEVSVGGASKVVLQRLLLTQDGEFFDDDAKAYVSVAVLVNSFLKDAQDVISEFESFVA